MVLGRLIMEYVVAGIEDEKVGRLKAMFIGRRSEFGEGNGR